MRKAIAGLFVILTVTIMTGCGCNHEWEEATCLKPKTCSLCGKQEGSVTAHEWKEANCTEAKTCEVCQATEGEPRGHNWEEATCERPKTCLVCNATEGLKADHSVQVGICAVCGDSVNYDLVKNIKSYIDTAYAILYSYANNLSDIRGSKADKAIYLHSGVCDANENYKKVIDLCDDYPELSALKTYAQNITDATPKGIEDETNAAADLYLNQFGAYIQKPANLEIELLRVEDFFNN